MYEDQYQVSPRKKIIKILIITCALAAFVWLGITLLLNGFVDSASLDKDEVLTFSRIENGKVVESTEASSGYTQLHAGDYSVKIAPKNTRAHSTVSLHVDNFFRVTKLDFSEKNQASSQLMYTIAGTNFIAPANKLTSYRSGGTVLFNDEDPLSQPFDTCDQACMSLYPYDDTQMIGLLGKEGRVKYVATIASPSTLPSHVDDMIYPVDSQLIRSRDDGSFAVYDGKSQLSYYKNLSSKPIVIKLENKPAMGEDQQLISLADQSILVGSGKDYSNPVSGDGGDGSTTDSPDDYRFDTYSTVSGTKTGTFQLKNHTQLRSISISPHADYYTASSSSTIEIGAVSDGKISTTHPYITSQIIWTSQGTFVYYDVDAVYMSDLKGTTWPVFSNKSMNISSVDLVAGKLYISAIFTDDPDQQSNAIVVDVTKPAVDNSLLSYNPLQLTGNYSIRFNGQSFTLYVTANQDGSTPSSEDLDPAYNYMKITAPGAPILVSK